MVSRLDESSENRTRLYVVSLFDVPLERKYNIKRDMKDMKLCYFFLRQSNFQILYHNIRIMYLSW